MPGLPVPLLQKPVDHHDYSLNLSKNVSLFRTRLGKGGVIDPLWNTRFRTVHLKSYSNRIKTDVVRASYGGIRCEMEFSMVILMGKSIDGARFRFLGPLYRGCL